MPWLGPAARQWDGRCCAIGHWDRIPFFGNGFWPSVDILLSCKSASSGLIRQVCIPDFAGIVSGNQI
jgi:hypothetical protein